MLEGLLENKKYETKKYAGCKIYFSRVKGVSVPVTDLTMREYYKDIGEVALYSLHMCLSMTQGYVIRRTSHIEHHI